MAERLTEKDKYGNNAIFQKKDKFTIAKDKNNDIRVYGKAIDKLAQLEDIMEKYHCNDIEELEKKLADSDTWQKACELACVELDCNDNYYSETYTIPLKEMPQYFHQQAKKEGNDE